MPKVTAQISISLDGYAAGPNQSLENPLGEGGEQLHEWALALQAWRSSHGYEGGDVNASSQVMDEMFANVGATVMGRGMFGGKGSWDENPWDGWWGEDPPYHMPVFVLTHHPREPLEMKGGTTFHFVTDGIDSAMAQALAAAGGKDVLIGGGASTIQQALNAGLVDELTLNIAPILLGGGELLLDGLGDAPVKLERTRVIEGPTATHLTYRVTGV